jgi:hypothetical protein
MKRLNNPAQLRTLIAVAEDAGARVRSVLDDLEGAGVLEPELGAWGAKIRSRLTLVAARLGECERSFRRQLAKLERTA